MTAKKHFKIRINTHDGKEFWLNDYGLTLYRGAGRTYRTHSEAVFAAMNHPERFVSQFSIVPYYW